MVLVAMKMVATEVLRVPAGSWLEPVQVPPQTAVTLRMTQARRLWQQSERQTDLGRRLTALMTLLQLQPRVHMRLLKPLLTTHTICRRWPRCWPEVTALTLVQSVTV